MPLDHAWIEQHIPAQGTHVPAGRGAVLGCGAHQLPQRHPSCTRQPAARPRPAGCRLRHRVRGAGDGGARRADRASAPLASTVSSAMRGSIGAAVGYLASVRNVALHVARLDDLAERSDGSRRAHHRRWPHGALRVLGVARAGRVLVSGRASIVFGQGTHEQRQRALVTGGSGGIGGAICRRLARDGHYVYVHCHRGLEAAQGLVRDIAAAGGRRRDARASTSPTPPPRARRSRQRSRPGRSRSWSTTPASTMTPCCPA